MFSIKTGTQTFSTKTEAPLAGAPKGAKTMSAQDHKKFFGDKAVGDIANQVADPNWVDPSKTVRNVGNANLDKDAFMKLLLTQMKNQDPTNPMKSHEMAAQLAQFSSLEKLQNIDTSIGDLAKAQAPDANLGALKMIGQTISGDGAKLYKSDLEQPLDIRFNLANTATQADVVIKDANGNIVRELKAFDLQSGSNEVRWDGKMNNGAQARQGDYFAEIKAQASNGTKVTVESKFAGKVTGVNFTSQGPVLMLGSKSVKMSDVKSIVDPNIKVNQEGVQKAIVKDAEKQTEVAAQTTSELEGVAMSRGMVNKMKKSGVNTKAY